MIMVCFVLKKRNAFSIHKRQVTFIMIVFSLLYLGILYFIGLFSGFKMAKIFLSFETLITIIFPLVIIIISSEVIRKIFLAQQIKFYKFNLSLIFTFISMVMIDLVLYINIYDLYNLEKFWESLSYVFLSSISCNLLYNYVSSRYGSKGIISYRLITYLYGYIIPIVPDVYIFFNSFFRMLYPYLIYIILEEKYVEKDYAISNLERRSNLVTNIFLLLVMLLIIMLISCQFKYGIIVVGSHSMRNSLNVGDAIVYENYDGEIINKGQVIVFNYNEMQTIHRVVDIKNVNGEYRFYTKGDANTKMDNDYRTIDEIKGLVKLKIKYIGYPTLWVYKLFS
jgi:signal peptidase I